MGQVDFSEKPTFWKALKPPLKDKCGELLVSLCYHPTNSTLTLIVLKARSLKAKDINGKSGNMANSKSSDNPKGGKWVPTTPYKRKTERDGTVMDLSKIEGRCVPLRGVLLM